MENNNVDDVRNSDEQPSSSGNKVNEWLNVHSGIRRLISLAMVLVFFAVLFAALRSLGIYRMDHYATYAINQAGLQGGARGDVIPGINGRIQNVTVENEPDIQGCEQYVTLTVVFSSDMWKLEGYYARFTSKEAAQLYLTSQKAEESRNRYVLGNYYFDFPRKQDVTGLDADAKALAESYNSAVSDLLGSELLITMILYRAFVVFDFSTGLEGDFVQGA